MTEQVLIAIQALGEKATLLAITDLLARAREDKVTVGAVWVTLDRLRENCYISGYMGPKKPKRGGKAVEHYRLEKRGLDWIERAERIRTRLKESA